MNVLWIALLALLVLLEKLTHDTLDFLELGLSGPAQHVAPIAQFGRSRHAAAQEPLSRWRSQLGTFHCA